MAVWWDGGRCDNKYYSTCGSQNTEKNAVLSEHRLHVVPEWHYQIKAMLLVSIQYVLGILLKVS